MGPYARLASGGPSPALQEGGVSVAKSRKVVVADDDDGAFGDQDLSIEEHRIPNPEPKKTEQIDIDTIDISDIKTRPVTR
jgi:hypothetical protein